MELEQGFGCDCLILVAVVDVTLVPGKGKVCYACFVETPLCFFHFSLVCLVCPLNISMCNISRYWITQRRCEKTLQHLPATPHERLPLLHHPDHPMSKIGRHRMFVRLHKHPNVILVRNFFVGGGREGGVGVDIIMLTDSYLWTNDSMTY